MCIGSCGSEIKLHRSAVLQTRSGEGWMWGIGGIFSVPSAELNHPKRSVSSVSSHSHLFKTFLPESNFGQCSIRPSVQHFVSDAGFGLRNHPARTYLIRHCAIARVLHPVGGVMSCITRMEAPRISLSGHWSLPLPPSATRAVPCCVSFP